MKSSGANPAARAGKVNAAPVITIPRQKHIRCRVICLRMSNSPYFECGGKERLRFSPAFAQKLASKKYRVNLRSQFD